MAFTKLLMTVAFWGSSSSECKALPARWSRPSTELFQALANLPAFFSNLTTSGSRSAEAAAIHTKMQHSTQRTTPQRYNSAQWQHPAGMYCSAQLPPQSCNHTAQQPLDRNTHQSITQSYAGLAGIATFAAGEGRASSNSSPYIPEIAGVASSAVASAPVIRVAAASLHGDIPVLHAIVILDDYTSTGSSCSSSSSTDPDFRFTDAAPVQQAMAQQSSQQWRWQQQQWQLQEALLQLHASAVPAATATARGLVGNWYHQDDELLSELVLNADGTMTWKRWTNGTAKLIASSSSSSSSGGSIFNPSWWTGACSSSPGGSILHMFRAAGTASSTDAYGRAGTDAAATSSSLPDSSSTSSQKAGAGVTTELLGIWQLVHGSTKQGLLQLKCIAVDDLEPDVNVQEQQQVIAYQCQALEDANMFDGVAHVKIS